MSGHVETGIHTTNPINRLKVIKRSSNMVRFLSKYLQANNSHCKVTYTTLPTLIFRHGEKDMTNVTYNRGWCKPHDHFFDFSFNCFLKCLLKNLLECGQLRNLGCHSEEPDFVVLPIFVDILLFYFRKVKIWFLFMLLL